MVWAAEVTDSDAVGTELIVEDIEWASQANFVHPVVCLPASKVVIAPVSECLEGIRKGGAMLLDFNVTKVEHDVIYTMWFSSDVGYIYAYHSLRTSSLRMDL